MRKVLKPDSTPAGFERKLEVVEAQAIECVYMNLSGRHLTSVPLVCLLLNDG